MSIDRNKILRFLHGTEFYHDKYKKSIPSAVLIVSDINLFLNKDSIEKAVYHWKQLHPLLRCRIHTEYYDDKHINKWFCYADDEKINESDNVSYLKISEEDESCWKLLFEAEYADKIDSNNGLLWRLKIIDINYDEQIKKFRYWFFFTVYHSISDGKNTYALILELCSLIQDAYYNKLQEISEEQKLMSKLEYDYPNDPRYGVEMEFEASKSFILQPPFTSCKIVETLVNSNHAFCLNIDEIINLRKNFITGFQYLKINRNDFIVLRNKAKTHDVKMTSCLALMAFLGLKNAYKHFFTNITEETFVASVPVNLRQFLTNPSLSYNVASNWMTRLQIIFENHEVDDDLEFLKFKFWNYANAKSVDFHKRLANKEYLRSLNDRKALLESLKNGAHEDSLKKTSHISFSNIGVQDNCLKNNTLICIKEFYSGITFIEKGPNMSQHCIVTIDDELFWSLTYNRNNFTDEFISYWIDQILNIAQVLIN